MSILIKLMNGNRERGILCETYELERVFVDGKAAGVKVKAMDDSSHVKATVSLPEDGQRIYLENDKGLTIDVITWPPRAKPNSQFRAMGDQQ